MTCMNILLQTIITNTILIKLRSWTTYCLAKTMLNNYHNFLKITAISEKMFIITNKIKKC